MFPVLLRRLVPVVLGRLFPRVLRGLRRLAPWLGRLTPRVVAKVILRHVRVRAFLLRVLIRHFGHLLRLV